MFFLSFSGKILPQTLQSSVVCISHSQLSFVLSLVFFFNQTFKHDVSHYWGDGLYDSGPLVLFWHQRLTHTVSGPKRRKVSADYLVVWGSDISISFPFNPAESSLTPTPPPPCFTAANVDIFNFHARGTHWPAQPDTCSSLRALSSTAGSFFPNASSAVKQPTHTSCLANNPQRDGKDSGPVKRSGSASTAASA